MKSRACPHCNVVSNFTDEGSYTGGEWGRGENRKSVKVEFWGCQNCEGVIVLRFEFDKGHWPEVDMYPAAIASVDESVNKSASEDYISGVNCMGIGETKAAVTMFRRSLQQVMINKGAKGNRLVDQIRSLGEKGILSGEIVEWANEIRLWGNEGAHPAGEEIDNITVEQADEIKEFIDRLFEWVYIMPERVKKSRLSREAKKSKEN